jgi:hypothetical protein
LKARTSILEVEKTINLIDLNEKKRGAKMQFIRFATVLITTSKKILIKRQGNIIYRNPNFKLVVSLNLITSIK